MKTRSVIRSSINSIDNPAKSIPEEPEGSPYRAAGSVASMETSRFGVVNDAIIQSGKPFVKNDAAALKFLSVSLSHDYS